MSSGTIYFLRTSIRLRARNCKKFDTVVICPLTSQLHTAWRSRIQIQCGGKPAEIAVDQIRTVSRKRLKNKIDHLSDIPARNLRQLITEMYGE